MVDVARGLALDRAAHRAITLAEGPQEVSPTIDLAFADREVDPGDLGHRGREGDAMRDVAVGDLAPAVMEAGSVDLPSNLGAQSTDPRNADQCVSHGTTRRAADDRSDQQAGHA